MISVIRKRVTYANVALTLALVFLMSGGALAAGHYLITSTKQINPKVLKALKGASGANGRNGDTGAQGPQGPQGAKGEAGAIGAPGGEGKAGSNGASVITTAVPVGSAKCEEKGGAEFKVGAGTATFACNGETGFTEALPTGKTETGVWATTPSAEGFAWVSISFNIPLAVALNAEHVHYVAASGNGSTCPGTAVEPKAEPGNLCVYESDELNLTHEPQNVIDLGARPGASRVGAVVVFEAGASGPRLGLGSWAVTAE